MPKFFFLTILLGALISGCGGTLTPASTSTVVPSVTSSPSPMLLGEVQLETETGTAYTLAWSPEGETLVVASGSEITLLSANLREIRSVLKPEGGALGITWKPDKTQFATVNGFRNPIITLWDWNNASAQITRVQEIQADLDQYGVAWSPDGKVFATLAGDSKTVFQIWDTGTWEEIQRFDLSYTKPRRSLTWSADSSTLYAAGELPGKLVILAMNMSDGTATEFGKFPVGEAEVFAVSPDADRIALSDPRGVVLIVDSASGDRLQGFKSVDQTVDLAWNPNGLTLAILSYEGALQLWEIPR